MRSVSGEPLTIYSKAKTRIQAGGLTSIVDVYVVDGIRPQLILGLPWIKKEQPQVEWGDAATLVFPDGSKWVREEETCDVMLLPTLYENPGLCAHVNVVHNEMGGAQITHPDQLKEEETVAVIADWIKGVINTHRVVYSPHWCAT